VSVVVLAPRVTVQYAVLDAHDGALARVVEPQVQDDRLTRRRRAVQAHRKIVEDIFEPRRSEHAATGHVAASRVVTRRPGAQLLSTGQKEVPPRRVFGLVTELLECVGLELARLVVRRIGENEVVDELRHPSVFAAFEGGTRLLHESVGAAGELDVARPRLLRR